ncbi:hypothetical protein JCM19046_233 [Bacillus sp. JCM 19046]|nr:hypothetical protein JCM19046_233 [Bacillus sp. JCM 19046]
MPEARRPGPWYGHLEHVKAVWCSSWCYCFKTIVSLNAAKPDHSYVEGTLIGLRWAFLTMSILSLLALLLVIFAQNRSKSTNTLM